ncbi:MAG: NAD(P)-dependent oxidoreductase [Alphaproteobacteria bacterium]|nr:NAD(P)-dependent oxidoreductase [Alphaproteobacteria bacterium]
MAKEKKKETVLVLGGGGFLGSHTADALSAAGYKVRIFDRTPSPYLSPEQEMIVGDIMDTELISKVVKGCDYIYHFAGIADLEDAKQRPVDTCRINVLGTVQALEAARKIGIKRFIFASTVYVYSNSGGFYRASKQACENFIEEYHKTYDLPYTILRYGSLYGRRAGLKNGINRLIRSAIEDGEIIYNGDPEAMREYIHVNDAAQLSVDILDKKYANRRLMLTGQNRMRVVDLMKMIAEMVPNKPQVNFGEKTLSAHYVMTPYNYNPKLAHKLTSNDHIELGQGLLDCIDDIYENED